VIATVAANSEKRHEAVTQEFVDHSAMLALHCFHHRAQEFIQ